MLGVLCRRRRFPSGIEGIAAFCRGTTALIFGQRRLLDANGVLLAALPTGVLGETGPTWRRPAWP